MDQATSLPRRTKRRIQADLTRALKAAKAAGTPVAKVRIDRDGVELTMGPPVVPSSQGGNPWDA
jgi:hypothetical protein